MGILVMARFKAAILALALGLVACLEPDSERMVLKLLHRASQNGTAAIAAADEASRTVSASLESTLAGLVDGIQHLDCVAKKNCPKAAHADSIEPLEHEMAETDLRSREDLTENRTLVEVGVVKQMRARYVKQMQNVKAYRMDLEDKIKAHVASNEGLRKMIKGLKVEDEEKALEGSMAASIVKQEMEKMRRIVAGVGMTSCGITGCGGLNPRTIIRGKFGAEENKGKAKDGKPVETEYQYSASRNVRKELSAVKEEVEKKDSDAKATAEDNKATAKAESKGACLVAVS